MRWFDRGARNHLGANDITKPNSDIERLADQQREYPYAFGDTGSRAVDCSEGCSWQNTNRHPGAGANTDSCT